ncbi:MAG: SulP family inorganic anion transporter [Pseudomonadota bacterium]
MNFGTAARQISAGCIVGLSTVIYAISYGALLFTGPLTPYVGYGIAAALSTAAIGALFGWLSEERTFISGPDSNTISVLVAMMAVIVSTSPPGGHTVSRVIATLCVTSLVCAVVFYLLARFRLAGLIRYIPFSVMAGFLAATGWLMCSGAMHIIAGTPLNLEGLAGLLDNPYRPELVLGLAVVVALHALAPLASAAVLIPVVMLGATLLTHAFLASGVCHTSICSSSAWMFGAMPDVTWLPPWGNPLDWGDLRVLLYMLPSMLMVSFVGLLTILLSLASLELNYQKEFDLNRVLNTHAVSTAASALAGGFVGIISIGRTTLNQQTGGGALSGGIAAAICVAMLLGAANVITYVPKAALGGLVLYLGLGMLKQWLWQQRKPTSRDEFLQIVLIVVLVANYGYLVGFAAGVLIACSIFVLTYSKLPLTSVSTTLAVLASSVVRSDHAMTLLGQQGDRSIVYRLQGYVFFGSANKIDSLFQTLDIASLDCVILDFTKVSGIDRAAVGVLQRILRRYRDQPLRFYFVVARGDHGALQSVAADVAINPRMGFFATLDEALEAAEDCVLDRHATKTDRQDCFEFLENSDDRATFQNYCTARAVKQGELLCGDGDLSDAIYFIAGGSFNVIKPTGTHSGHRLAKISGGAMVGEMAFYTGQARAASIIAVVDSKVYALDNAALKRMRLQDPNMAMRFDHMVIAKLSHALRRANRLSATLG